MASEPSKAFRTFEQYSLSSLVRVFASARKLLDGDDFPIDFVGRDLALLCAGVETLGTKHSSRKIEVRDSERELFIKTSTD